MPKANLDQQWRYEGTVYGPGEGNYPKEVLDAIKEKGGATTQASSAKSDDDE